MASIIKRKKKYSVVYYVDEGGEKKQKWETCNTYPEAVKRKAEIEYQQANNTFVPPSVITVADLLRDYIELYGVQKWALSTYSSNKAIIANYILPKIGDMQLRQVTPKFIDEFYKKLETTRAVGSGTRKKADGIVSPYVIREIHKILRSAFNQAVKWEYIIRNPVSNATIPKIESEKRCIWTAEEIAKALSICEDRMLYICINLAFACSMRVGEIVGLTWDCVFLNDNVSDEDESSYLLVNKELSRVSREAMQKLNGRDVMFTFPPVLAGNSTVLTLKAPKTKSSVRKIWLPPTTAEILKSWKNDQNELKNLLGSEYQSFSNESGHYDLVITQSNGRPLEERNVNKALKKLIQKGNLPQIVFHSLRHSSTTYKLKLNNGDIKATQGDTGHAQPDMVTKVYAHILDEDRKVNATKFEKMFYAKKFSKTPPMPDMGAEAFKRKVTSSPELMDALRALLN